MFHRLQYGRFIEHFCSILKRQLVRFSWEESVGNQDVYQKYQNPHYNLIYVYNNYDLVYKLPVRINSQYDH